MAQVEQVVAAATELPPVADGDILAHFNDIKSVWGGERILSVSAAELRAKLADVLSRSLSEGFRDIVIDTVDAPFACVEINAFGSFWRPYRVAKTIPTGGEEDRFALYGHSSLYLGDVRYLHSEKDSKGAVFHVHRARSRVEALDFLRQKPVRENLVYLIVETPQGNVGRDVIHIFEEQNGKPIEFGVRPRVAQPKPSTTNCAWCGFHIFPINMESVTSGPSTVQLYLTIREMKNSGIGFRCESCALLQCAFCTDFPESATVGDPAPCRFCDQNLAANQMIKFTPPGG